MIRNSTYTKLHRIYIESAIAENNIIELSKIHAHYLEHVLRYKEGSEVILFNGRDGEWLAEIIIFMNHHVKVQPLKLLREQKIAKELILYFSPLKNNRTNNIIEKATELGVTIFQPVLYDRTIARDFNVEKMQKIAIEAAEQAERNEVPKINELVKFRDLIQQQAHIIVANEASSVNLIESLEKTESNSLMVGPEGGFSSDEQTILKGTNFMSISLGPRILRADTASISLVTAYQIIKGDWK